MLYRYFLANKLLIAGGDHHCCTAHTRLPTADFSWERSRSTWNLKRSLWPSEATCLCHWANPLLLEGCYCCHLGKGLYFTLVFFLFAYDKILCWLPFSSVNRCMHVVWCKELVWIHGWAEEGLWSNDSLPRFFPASPSLLLSLSEPHTPTHFLSPGFCVKTAFWKPGV